MSRRAWADGPDSWTRRERRRMVRKQLRSRGVRDSRVLEAMAEVRREAFLPPESRRWAYADRALPLACGQTMSQPYMVAVMSEALMVAADHRVLEIGTGSGYQTAVLARLASEVYSIERFPALADEARRSLEEVGVANTRIRTGDGTLGWPEEAPFDRILVTAGAPLIPRALRDQLAPDGGRLVAPVGDRGLQRLTVLERHGATEDRTRLVECRFVPLVGAEGWDE